MYIHAVVAQLSNWLAQSYMFAAWADTEQQK